MLTLRRIYPVIILVLTLILQGCGFQPIYASRTQATDMLSQIGVAPIADRSGQILRNYLLDRLGPRGGGVSQRFTLVVRLQEPRQVLALRRDDVISRVGYAAAAIFHLNDENGRRIFSGTSSFSTDYEVTNSEYATLVSQQSARDRTLELVSDDIRSQLAAYLARR